MGNENRDIAPVLLKFGVALALSFGGALYSLIVNKRSRASQSPNDHRNGSDRNKQENSRSNHLRFDPLATDKHEESHHSNNTKFVRANSESPKGHSHADKGTDEQEIKSLRNTVKILKERESSLEIKLLEYYGLKEQETIVMELQNRLKLNNMAAKFFTLKIESLQADNKRLQAQMSDYKKVLADLEDAQIKINILKKMNKSEAQQHKKQILDFHQRVQKMQEDENKHVVAINPEIESELRKVKNLEAEVAELRRSNHDLQLEKADLVHRLDCAQMLATSVLEDAECEKVKVESQNLKKQNEDLSNRIERLQSDRCSDVEQLVYLRWINACLRYELRNHQPPPGKSTARDLNKTLSPESQHKAKQLILEYAHKEDHEENCLINLHEIDYDQRSYSQASVVMDSGEFDESVIEDNLRHKNSKLYGKLMRGYRRNHSRNSCRRRRSEYGGEEIAHRHSDSSFYDQIDSDVRDEGGGRGGGGGGGRWSCSSFTGGRKSELVKYAEALKDSRGISSLKFHKTGQTVRIENQP